MANLDFDNLQSKRNYSRYTAYSRSKLAQVLHANKLQRRLEGSGVTICALHPGVVNTSLWRDLPGPLKYIAFGLGSVFFKTPVQGAETTIWAATADELEGVGGKYYSDCREIPSSAQSRDIEAQDKLWRASLELVGLPAEEDETEAEKKEEDTTH
ncbi:retinol dehydrogenase 14 (all-trans and 9-cis) family protein [Acanthamoeba castellanii str. Neff]|uniref:Retinol dehydrogenase 14 (All-trans and 9-cis) family protein n=1 Tax=Acanthamoeba castellanii (strain ATCC 30010 / Neff) TaxID=1257118 RepID=L8GTX6_ACACF|nr:retinol dehydrogenase 14 (all-trans and 9-cis) family protein [Acanthamoeba castellanii str. Neff]ELR16604.1 retinol dehydrogenase 14 (all-trans and 9-cis) family protein [Acanthamoeba castellanii str. Neff]